MIKASAGGGGMGMAVADDADQRGRASSTKVTAFAERIFGDPAVLLERIPAGGPARRGADPRPGRRRGASPSASGTARCSGATRRWPRRPRPRPWTSRTAASGCWPRPCGPARRSATAAPGTVECLRRRRPARRVRLPGDEHPAAGRAPDHRGGHWASTWCEQQLLIAAGEPIDLRPVDRRAQRACHRVADQRRGSQAVPARPRRDHATGWNPPATGIRVDAGLRRRDHRHARTTTR